MSIKTTHVVTKEFALAAIYKKLEEGLTNEQLENILETAIHNGFYNFSIVNEIGDYPWYLDNLNNLPEYNNAW